MSFIISQPIAHKIHNEGERTIRNTNCDKVDLIDSLLDLDLEDGDYNYHRRKTRYCNCIAIKKLVI